MTERIPTAIRLPARGVMQERGFIHQCSRLPRSRRKSPLRLARRLCIGFDCTVAVAACRQSRRHHDAALAPGDGGKAGGAHGAEARPWSAIRQAKDESRKLLTVQEIEANKAGIRKAFSALHPLWRRRARRHRARQRGPGSCPAQLHRFPARRRTPFLGQPHAGYGLRSSSELTREQELSFLEFNFMCAQSFTIFTELNKRSGVTLQMGGSDQWGEISSPASISAGAWGSRRFTL